MGGIDGILDSLGVVEPHRAIIKEKIVEHRRASKKALYLTQAGDGTTLHVMHPRLYRDDPIYGTLYSGDYLYNFELCDRGDPKCIKVP